MRAWTEIDKDKLINNVQAIQAQVGREIDVIAVLKSDAYGLGISNIAPLIEQSGLNMCAVISLSEAQAVRQCSRLNVLILGECTHSELEEAIRSGFHISVFDTGSLPVIERIAERLRIAAKIHMMIETGLHREGVSQKEGLDYLANQRHYPFIKVVALYSHFSSSGERDKCVKQSERLRQFLAEGHGFADNLPIHFVSSFSLPHSMAAYYDAVRVGLSLYGYGPLSALQPALKIKCRISQLRSLEKGDQISYDGLFTCINDTRIAVIAAGYYEGISTAGADLEVLIRGQRAKILGKVCMNMCVVDVGQISDISLGDEVVLLGQQSFAKKSDEISLTELAQKTGLRHHEIVLRFARGTQKVIK